MKAKLLRPPVFGACFAALAAIASAQADVTTTTVSYNVVPGACSAPIAVPANNKPVLMMGSGFVAGYQGISETVLLRAVPSSPLLDWAGTSGWGTFDGLGLERNYTSGVGTHIMWTSYGSYVDVQSASSTHVMVCNASGSPIAHATGYLTFIY